jgi:ribosomal protein S6
MKKYEGLFILNLSGKEDAAKDVLDAISNEIVHAGGKVETVQKMDRKAFARVADKRHSAGFYANVIFSGTPTIVAQLQKKFSLNEEIFRVLFTLLPEPKAEPVKA